ncbi:inorganic phosphate transporter [Actinacidiphila glaucinigra]|uniref:inorganic phosphate transporter n=1 Tax=Actinacidiphila glaucinigra TaxID=235986 RepID=UPI002E3084A6|nr:inorganic phosphate transporter [Actinacidiphila glaucinigra]
MDILVLVLVLALAAANGANDVPKGVATLAGAGEAKIKTAIAWGTVTTAVGCLVSLHFANKMTALFSKGIVSASPTNSFAAAVLLGTAAWIALATWRGLPVSTTHALTGSLLGAGALFASSAVQWSVLLVKVVQPLLLSVVIAWAISAALSAAGRGIARRRAQRVPQPLPDPDPVLVNAGAAEPQVHRAAAPAPAAGAEQAGAGRMSPVSIAHWATSGLTSFARGMNDAPKIVAIGSFALVSGMTTTHLLVAVTLAMAVGGLLVGRRVAERMANDVIKMTHVEGFTANLTTAALVGVGAFQGLPMSTTQVSIGAISGTAGADLSRIKKKTVRDFAVAWLVTPPFSAAVAAVAYLLLR